MNTLIGKALLVAEDDAFARKVVRLALERMGADTICCEDGAHALRVLNEPRHLDGALLDIIMPQAHGLHVLRQIRSASTAQHFALPVAMLTATHDEACVRAAAALSCDGFIAKPVAPAALTDRLNKMFTRHLSLPYEPRHYRKIEVGSPDRPPTFSSRAADGSGELVLAIDDIEPGMQFATAVFVNDRQIVPAERYVTDALLRLLRTLDKVEPLGSLVMRAGRDVAANASPTA